MQITNEQVHSWIQFNISFRLCICILIYIIVENGFVLFQCKICRQTSYTYQYSYSVQTFKNTYNSHFWMYCQHFKNQLHVAIVLGLTYMNWNFYHLVDIPNMSRGITRNLWTRWQSAMQIAYENRSVWLVIISSLYVTEHTVMLVKLL